MRIAFLTLGCKVNACETEKMKQQFEAAGHSITAFSEQADVYIVNTCTVTNIADRKSRKMLHRARRMNPHALVVATGCYVDSSEKKGEQDAAIDLLVPNAEKGQIVDCVVDCYEKNFGQTAGEMPEIEEGQECQEQTAEERQEQKADRTQEAGRSQAAQAEEHTRAYLKVQEGCNQYCSYCIIPYVRGPLRSKPVGQVLDEVRELAAQGFREIVITGIHLSSYGVDGEDARAFLEKKGEPLLELLETIHEVAGIDRIRLGSLEPRIITEEFAIRLAALPKICPHFHLSLQSGCDTVLKRMNRHYTSLEYQERVEILRRVFVHPAITTDIIVGFPQESGEEFEITRRFAEALGFAQIHVFKYSRRYGTVADGMDGQVAENIKNERSDCLLQTEAELERKYQEYFVGTVEEILIEESATIQGKTYLVGYNSRYVRIAVPVPDGAEAEKYCNTLMQVKILGHLNGEILLGMWC